MNLIRNIPLYLNILRHRGLRKKTQYSRWGEDLFLIDYFKNVPVGRYIDVGAFHPFRGSNTYFLYKKGWNGINVDLNKTSIDLFKIARPKDINLNLVISDVDGKVKVYQNKELGKMNTINPYHASIFLKNFQSRETYSCKLNDILDKYGQKNKQFELLDIDVEGTDYLVLKNLDFSKYKFKLILVEAHEFDPYFREQKQRIYALLQSKKYKYLKQFGETSVFENIEWTVSSAG